MLRYATRLSVSIVTFLVGLTLSFTPTPFSSEAPRGCGFESEVLEANRKYLEAHVSRDVAALEGLLADEFVMSWGYGRVTGKKQRLALVADPDFTFIDIDSRETRVSAGADSGEVSGRAVLKGSRRGRVYTSPPYGYTRRFERRDGRWQMVRVEFSGDRAR
jgi:hypothetical protein